MRTSTPFGTSALIFFFEFRHFSKRVTTRHFNRFVESLAILGFGNDMADGHVVAVHAVEENAAEAVVVLYALEGAVHVWLKFVVPFVVPERLVGQQRADDVSR